MEAEKLLGLIDKHDKEYGKFQRIASKRSKFAEAHAMLLLEELVPDWDNEEDGNYIAEPVSLLLGSEVIQTEQQVIELLRCGVTYDEERDCLVLR